MTRMKERTQHYKRESFCTPPTDEERAALMDPDYWDWEKPIAGIPVENPQLELGIVLDLKEARLLGEAARTANLPMNQYIKQAALATAKGAKG
jgi:hypothetical protein